MSDELLPYYNRELAFVRRLGAEFASAHPRIAGRLRLTSDGTEDPHVSRLIEAFAFLNARIRHKLEDDFPELTDALLGILYPHYVRPIPSMSIVEFRFDRSQGDLVAGYSLERRIGIETEPIQGDPVRFRTCLPVQLWPIEVQGAQFKGGLYTAPQTRFSSETRAILRIDLRCLSRDVAFKNIPLNSLRFYLKGQAQHTFPLYELLFNNVLGVALANSPTDKTPVLLESRNIQPVGFERDDGLLPYSARSFLGYRLLAEYFAFPQKFLFFDLLGLTPDKLKPIGNKMELYFYLNRSIPELEQNISGDMFRMGCSPVVNLFTQRAEPIALTHGESEYRVVPDARRPLATEVYSVDKVTATSPRGERVEYVPFYSCKHGVANEKRQAFYHVIRRNAPPRDGVPDLGTEVYLSLVDLSFSPNVAPEWVLDVQTECLSRDLPARLPYGGNQPELHLAMGGGPIERLICLMPPTRTLRPTLQHGALWRLVSHLALNHLSLSEDGLDALREILRLYDFQGTPETRAGIDGILSMKSRRVVGPVAGQHSGAFCRGLEVTLEFDETKYLGGGLYLFASILERFFGLYCSVNSFSKMIARTKQREGDLHRWPPRAGEKVLL